MKVFRVFAQSVVFGAMFAFCVEVGADEPPLIGDLDRDGVVSSLELTALVYNYGMFIETGDSWQYGDFNGDCLVDISDFNGLLSNLGNTAVMMPRAPTPEPGTAVLLGIGLFAALLVYRRRRRTAS